MCMKVFIFFVDVSDINSCRKIYSAAWLVQASCYVSRFREKILFPAAYPTRAPDRIGRVFRNNKGRLRERRVKLEKFSAVAFWLWQTIAKDRFAIVILLSVFYLNIFISSRSGPLFQSLWPIQYSRKFAGMKECINLGGRNLGENELVNPLHVLHNKFDFLKLKYLKIIFNYSWLFEIFLS